MDSSGTSVRHARMLAFACVVASSSLTLAHHSASIYDTRNGTRTVSGTVVKYSWTHPHVYIDVEVPDPDAPGKPQVWSFENGSPTQLSERGLTRQTLPVGTKVTMEYWPLRRGSRGGNCERIRLEDNRILECSGNPRARK